MKVVLFEERGEPTLRTWFLGLEKVLQRKWRVRIDLLEQFGLNLGPPFVEDLSGGSYALITQHHGNVTRLLFFVDGDMLVLCFPAAGNALLSEFERRRLKKARERFGARLDRLALGGPYDVS